MGIDEIKERPPGNQTTQANEIHHCKRVRDLGGKRSYVPLPLGEGGNVRNGVVIGLTVIGIALRAENGE